MSAVKPRVLELVTTPMGVDDGQTLFPLRIARRLTEVQADFLTFYVRDDRVREEVESLGGCIHVAPSRLRHLPASTGPARCTSHLRGRSRGSGEWRSPAGGPGGWSGRSV